MTLRQIVEMFGTNSRKVRNLGISEDLLARFDGYHWFNSSQFLQSSTLKNSDAMQRLRSPEDFLSSLWCEQPVLQKRPYKWDAQAKNNHQRGKHAAHPRPDGKMPARLVTHRTCICGAFGLPRRCGSAAGQVTE